jgi:hypothetical protein
MITFRDVVNSLIKLPGKNIPIEIGVEVDSSRTGGGIERHVLDAGGYREEIAVSYLRKDFEVFRKGIMENAEKEGFQGILMPKHADNKPVKDISCLGRVIADEFRYDIAGWVARRFEWYVKFLESPLGYAGAVFFPREGKYEEKIKSFQKIVDKSPYLIVFGNGNAIPERMSVHPGGIEIAALNNVLIIPIGMNYDSYFHDVDNRGTPYRCRIVFGKPIAPLEIVNTPSEGALHYVKGKSLIRVKSNLNLMLAKSAYILGKTHKFFDEEIPPYIIDYLDAKIYSHR